MQESGIVKEKVMPRNVNDYDVLYSDFPVAFLNENWGKIKIPKVGLVEDQHNTRHKKLVGIMQKHFDGIFVRYRDSFNENFPGVDKNKVYWLPHSIPPQDCYDYKLKKEIGALIVGQISGTYPLRVEMVEEFRGKSYFKQVERPKEILRPKDIKKLEAWPIGCDYYKLINSSKITLTSTSSKYYSLMKFFEIPGCKSALCSNYIEELGDLGFKPGTNMIEVNSKNMVKKVEDMLKNRNKLEDITEAGYEMVHKRHTVDIRANQFLEMIKEVVKKHG
jgi:hypothetical protein